MYRTKTNVFVHRTLLVLFFPSLFCQKTGFLIATDCCDSENKYITYFKNSQEVNRDFYIFFLDTLNCNQGNIISLFVFGYPGIARKVRVFKGTLFFKFSH